MRITYIIESLSNSGGMERVVTQKANWLVNKTNYKITIITFAQKINENDFFTLDENVNRIKWYWENSDKLHLLKKLEKWLMNNPQDICISTYGREFNILHKIKDGSKKIVEFHFAYDVNKHWITNTCNRWKAYIIGGLKTWFMSRTAKKYDIIVCLTEADYKRWNTDKIVQIYNPITIKTNKVSDCQSKVIVAIGRMDKQKGFDILLNCWKLLEDRYPEWQLKIYGGGDSSIYEKQISDLQLNHASILGRTNDVQSVLCESSIYVLCSRYEGFSLTICEAMNCGLPIVSFDCPSGPAELVADGVNGYIVSKVGDIESMAKCISNLIENEHLRKEFGNNSHQLSEKYQLDYVMNKWTSLFNQLAKSKIQH